MRKPSYNLSPNKLPKLVEEEGPFPFSNSFSYLDLRLLGQRQLRHVHKQNHTTENASNKNMVRHQVLSKIKVHSAYNLQTNKLCRKYPQQQKPYLHITINHQKICCFYFQEFDGTILFTLGFHHVCFHHISMGLGTLLQNNNLC